MRYQQGGGLDAERRAIRERVRQAAAAGFARGEESGEIARRLGVHVRSVQRWRRSWAEGGEGALASRGPASTPFLDGTQFALLVSELAKGPAAHGWPDRRAWTLELVRTLIRRRFGREYTVQGVAALLKRQGWVHWEGGLTSRHPGDEG
ncbi:hypothetical protein GCM10009665_39330 [Kitasatospora nipponensis]|uniref:Winged helix-turn helix domain-containing protein n=1 Tax=Kitasatospora nipponensis TaxID=258049 RepID=A0ABP4GZ85_9ACTN